MYIAMVDAVFRSSIGHIRRRWRICMKQARESWVMWSEKQSCLERKRWIIGLNNWDIRISRAICLWVRCVCGKSSWLKTNVSTSSILSAVRAVRGRHCREDVSKFQYDLANNLIQSTTRPAFMRTRCYPRIMPVIQFYKQLPFSNLIKMWLKINNKNSQFNGALLFYH